MKKSIKMLMVLAASIITLAACNKEEKDITVQGEKETFTVNFTASSDELTKVYFGDKDEGKYPAHWESGDRVAVIAVPVDADSNPIIDEIQAFRGESAATVTPSPDGLSANFSVEIVKNDNASGWIFAARYPDETFTGFGFDYDQNKPYLTFTIPTEQTPRTNPDSPDRKAMYLGAQKFVAQAEGNMNLDFNFSQRMVNFFKFSLKNLDETATVSEVKLAFKDEVGDFKGVAFGDLKYTFDLDEETYSTSGAFTGGGNEVTVKTSSREDIWVVLCCHRQIKNSKMEVTVVTDKGNYTKTIDFGSFGFEGGAQVGSFGINFAGIEPQLKGYNLVTDLSEVTDGDYVIAALNTKDNKYYALPALTKPSSGAISGIEVNIVNDVVAEADAGGKIWTLSRTENTVTLFDGKNFLFPKNTNNDLSYDVSSTNVWTLSDSGTEIVLNGEDGYTLLMRKYDNSTTYKAYKFSNYNQNPTDYSLVRLYKSGIVLTPRNLAWDSKTETATVGDSFTVSVTGDYTDGVTFSSSNTEVATIDATSGAVNVLKAGSTTITASAGKTEEYAAESISYELTVSSDAIFYESFDKCDGTGGNDEEGWSGSIASSTLDGSKCDNLGWTFVSGNAANGCTRFGAGSVKGSAETPAISLAAGTYTLTFKAGAWNGGSEGTTLNVSATNCNLSSNSVTLVKGEFSDYSIVITCTSATDVKIKFEAANKSNNRFFLDEVRVVAGGEAPEFLNVSSETVSVAYDATTASFDIESNVAWTITADPTVTLSSASGNGNATITVSGFEANATSAEKTISTLTIAGGESLTKTVVIKQAGNPNIVESKTVSEFISAADTETNYRLTGVVTEISGKNFTLTDATGSIYVYSIDQAPFVEGDIVTLRGKYKDYSGKDEVVSPIYESHVTTPKMSVSVESITVAASATSATFDITADSSVAWSVTSSNTDVTVSPASGTGNSAITLSFGANTGTSDRESVITVSSSTENVYKASYEIAFKQDGAVGEPTGITGYVRVEDTAWLHAGDKVVIAAVDSDVAMSTTQNSINRGQAAVTKGKSGSFATLTSDAGVQEFTLVAGNKENTWAFQTSGGYICAASSSSNYLKTETNLSNNSSWTVAITSGTATMTAQGSYTRNVLQYNSSSSLFSCYSSASQKAVSIYKWYGEMPQPSKLATPSPSFSNNTVSWSAIAYAQGYKVKVGAGEEISVSETSYSLASLAVGTYSVTVKAVGNGTTTVDSDWSAALSCTVTGGTGGSYTITFATGSGDGSNASTSTACSTVVSAGSNYLSGNLATATKVYYNGASGLKLGASSNAGTIKMNLSTNGQVTCKSIVVRAKLYNSSKATTLKVNDSATQNLGEDFADYTYSITGSLTYIELVSSKYCWIESVTVNY